MRRSDRLLWGLPAIILLTAITEGHASAASGGPDSFGYSFVDQSDGANYTYIDITGSGQLVALGNTESASVPLGAPFEIYGIPLADMVVTTNGVLTDDPLAAADISNDCPLPALPSSGGGFRIYALHDDLVAAVYYQFLDAPAASMAGYPGEADGLSVFQWTGTHNLGGSVDFEVLLFHDDFTILTMVALDAQGGSGSTTGIQDPAATTGLSYACDSALSITPGATAVQYTLGPPPDSDCCSASPTGVPGCINEPCQDAVCAVDPSCCETAWGDPCAGAALTECAILCGLPPEVTINEIRVDQDQADDDEYFELLGPPGTPLTDVQYIVLGDSPTGELEAVVDLTGQIVPPSGLLVVAEPSFSLGVADLTTFMNFENSDTVTHMLVGGLSAALSDNLDADGDGLLDSTPWITVLDTVSLIDPASTDLPYGPGSSCMMGPTCQEVSDGIDGPHQVYRCPDGDGAWRIGNTDEQAVLSTDSPGALNTCSICGNGALEDGEACDDAGDSALCDADCTPAACGDGTLNGVAGEECDDAGESAMCNLDCTLATCGDGLLNRAAGEACDDAGDSARCNADCSPAACGDGVLNGAAGEDCDDQGESATCDDDCTVAVCGDGLVNTTAGETCDDGGRSEQCNSDCTVVTCGDGLVNLAASEECDDAGESATCDADCTFALCGDGNVNASAGEDCDDAGESVTCDDDCTPAECGDGTINAAAGEQCDDGNTDDTDGCNADCTEQASADDTAGDGGSSGQDTDLADTAGGTPTDEGCGCTHYPPGRPLPWLLLVPLGRRRRDRSHGPTRAPTKVLE
ncbi:MAG: DUF4215 domain-containing protein [Myxococcota bacterium]